MRALTPTYAVRYAALATALPVLAACSDVAARDANAFSVEIEGETMSGIYDPAGFTELAIRDLLKFDCPSQRLAKYSERPGPRKLISFTATCAG